MQVEQSRFTLRFRHPGLEKTYQDRVYRSSLAKMRLGIVLAIVLFSAFALVDPVVSPENVGRSRFIRFGVALPTFLAMGALSCSAFLKSRLQLVFFVFGLSMAGFATVLFSEGEFAKFLYPAALLLFFLSTYLLSALRDPGPGDRLRFFPCRCLADRRRRTRLQPSSVWIFSSRRLKLTGLVS
jgi:hypothetical protein